MKRWVRIVSLVSILALVFGLGFMAGSNHPASVLAQSGQPPSTDKLFQPFWELWNMVHERYVDPIDDQALLNGAMTGMVAGLGDVHSAYMDPQLFASLSSDLSGEFEGIGATVRKDIQTGGLLVISTIDGAPAREAGLKSGDIIILVDDKDITALTETEIIGKVRGPAGTSVKISVFRQGQRKLIDLSITRAHIKVPIVTTAMYSGNIGYIQLSEFTEHASQDFHNALVNMKANKLNGLILDLRGNPGGGLQTAIDIASEFLSNGVIVIERGKPGTRDIDYQSTGNTTAPTVPLVVLVDASSASASELVSGALHDRGRALLVGTRTFGKGSVQEWTGLSNNGGLRITIAHFFTPTNRIINDIGILPDFVVPWDQEANPNFDPQLAEALMVLRGDL